MPTKRAHRAVPRGASHRSAAGAGLLFEIGVEELPHQFLPPALRSLGDMAERLLKEARLEHGRVRTMGTPRRLTLMVETLAERQTATVKEAMGPSKAVAYDASGQPTKAALGFATGQGVEVGDLEVRSTPKGEYVFAVKREPGSPASTVVAALLPQVVHGLTFPKAMRWNETGLRFARPIRWLVALYGTRVLPVQVADLRAGPLSHGHRFLGGTGGVLSRPVRIRDASSYAKILERRGVLVDPERRRTLIRGQLAKLAASAEGQVLQDEALLEQAVFSVEWPHAILGGFNPQYLALPKEVLITSMKEHQGFFSLVGNDGALLPKFIAVTNMKLPNMRIIRDGHERVLGARLADAKFFFDEDRKTPLRDRVPKLGSVIFHQRLGTMLQKSERVSALAEQVVNALGLGGLKEAARRAAWLSKADLLTGMVGEFPTLQGIMGREYARHDGEPPDVCQAIGEHYLPQTMEGEVPSTVVGRVVALADRLDSLAGFFCVGIVPTGSEDPFALRRQATAIVRILEVGQMRLPLDELLAKACHQVESCDAQLRRHLKAARAGESAGAPSDPLAFVADRLRHYGRSVRALRDDVMEAVLGSDGRRPFDVVDLLARMEAVQALTSRPEFDPLMIGFKRAHRLVEKEGWTDEAVDPNRFQHQAEQDLMRVLDESRRVVPTAIRRGAYGDALEALVRMKPAIDAFFVGVMVNAKDPALRANRLSLLRAVDRLFLTFADFSQIQVQGG